MLAKWLFASWVGCLCFMPAQTPLYAASPALSQQRTLDHESVIDPVRLEQILTWISNHWGIPGPEVLFDYQKDQILISPGPLNTFWKIHYRGSCAIVDLADLL